MRQRRSQRHFFANERLMRVHTILFGVFLLIYPARSIMVVLQDKYYNEEEWTKYCRLIDFYFLFKVVTSVVNIAILLLLTYMSTKLSRPLKQYWQNFLLVHQGSIRDMIRLRQVYVEHNRAEQAYRYYLSSIEDANRII